MNTMKCFNCGFETKPMMDMDLREYADLYFEYTKKKTKIDCKNGDYPWFHSDEWFCPICGDTLCWCEGK